jgi:hypothetical protein
LLCIKKATTALFASQFDLVARTFATILRRYSKNVCGDIRNADSYSVSCLNTAA